MSEHEFNDVGLSLMVRVARPLALVCGLLFCGFSPVRAESVDPRPEARQLLTKWCDALIGSQVSDPANPHLHGGALCSACGFLHARICDAVYPFVYLWTETGDAKYLTAARDALAWTERNYLRGDGSYWNDRKTPWKGTTVFCQIAIGKTLLKWGDRLPKAVADEWRGIFLRQSRFLISWFNDPKWSGVINYPSAYCEAMALAWKLTGDSLYRDEAERMWKSTVRPLFTEDGFLSGEGHPMRGRSSVRRLAFVDAGYNLEESLPALAAAAEILGDREMSGQVLASARAHMAFVLPDGAIDDSFGSRSVKWTYWGSRTSDGILPLYLFLARHGEPYAARGIVRTLRLYSELTAPGGFLYGGLRYADADEPPCLHHTFAHAKTLVDLLVGEPTPAAAGAVLPREAQNGLRTYPSLDVTLAAVGPWRATFSATDAFPTRGDALSGGSLTMLWHEQAGPVVCGTMPVYRYVEWVNQQDQRHAEETLCMTPRIVAEKLTNLADYEAEFSSREVDGGIEYEVSGHLTSPDAAARRGSSYTLRYVLIGGGLSLTASCAEGPFALVFPVVVDRSAKVDVKGTSAEIAGSRLKARLTASSELSLVKSERGEFAFSPIAGVLAAVFEVRSENGGTIRLDFSLDGSDLSEGKGKEVACTED